MAKLPPQGATPISTQTGTMGIKSMTGFATISGEATKFNWVWELRALNGRSLDLRVRLAAGFEALEPDLRALAARHLRRGACQISLQTRRHNDTAELRINEATFNRAIELLDRIRNQTDAQAPHADGILALKGVLEFADIPETDEERQSRCDLVLASLSQGLEALVEARAREGAKLDQVMRALLADITRIKAQIGALPARTPEAQMARLRQQLDRLSEAHGEFAAERLYQEAALLATKADIREELDRIDSHVEAAYALLETGEAIGRRLDFLAQEFNREANTICSKSTDIETTQAGLELKSVIDQLREQVQNVE
ncbi:MAG: YicC/YloC family endoribonuclease [Alphaproteobacteria bacterium]